MKKKVVLDQILKKYKAQPVGSGYIDIIVMRDFFQQFVHEVLQSGFNVSAVSWWEYCSDTEHKSKHGLGGPPSIFYDGWFSEIPIDLDEIKDHESTIVDKYKNIENIVLNKTISITNEKVTYTCFKNLVPAFWLDVPETWTNEYQNTPQNDI